jgi:predicted amidophosphoribosyltransferase
MFAEAAELLWPSECAGCGALGLGRICPDCTPPGLHRVRLGIPELAGCLVLASYETGVGTAVARAKARADRSLMSALARPFVSRLVDWVQEAGPSCVIPAPSTRWSLLRRGFSGAAVLARQVGAAAEVPVRPVLVRRGGARQSSLGLAERATNLRGRVRCDVPLQGRVLLIDDVVTTGATAQACARELLGAGAREVWLAALCAVRRG